MFECTVSELCRKISEVLKDNIDKEIVVTAEICSIKKSGANIWFDIKDSTSVAPAVIWKTYNFPYSEGDKVKINGYITHFAKRNQVMFVAKKLEKIGIGDVHKQYIENYKYLKSNGYFSDSDKPMPDKIESIGVLTAKAGDAIKDFLFVLNENGYKGTVHIYNCNVQGKNCPKSVMEGLDHFNSQKEKVDIIVLTRGGGSDEDLMGFSNMDMLKELYTSKIYTISAIGHENDRMLSDYVANHRSPTPSIAGRDICDQYNLTKNSIIEAQQILSNKIKSDIMEIKMHLNEISSKHHRLPDIISMIDWEIDNIVKMGNHHRDLIKSDIENNLKRIQRLKEKVEENSHDSILEKGYCLLLTKKGNIVKDMTKLKKHKNLKLYMNGISVNVILKISEDK